MGDDYTPIDLNSHATGLYSYNNIWDKREARLSDVLKGNKTKSLPPRSKTVTLLLIIFLGTLGAHRFYLRQYWRALFYIILLVFIWTYIPLIIWAVDIIVFVTMSKEKFDEKYNTGFDKKRCVGCGIPLNFSNKVVFGLGKLNDGKRVCRFCDSKITTIDASFTNQSKKNYNTQNVRRLLAYSSVRFCSEISGLHPDIIPPIITSNEFEDLGREIAFAVRVIQKINKELAEQETIKAKAVRQLEKKQKVTSSKKKTLEGIQRLESEIQNCDEAIENLTQSREKNRINIDVENKFQEQYDKVYTAFCELMNDNKVWKVIPKGSKQHTKKPRKLIRWPAKFDSIESDFVVSKFPVCHIKNGQGEHYYLYSKYILCINRLQEVYVIQYGEVNFNFEKRSVAIDEGKIPDTYAVFEFSSGGIVWDTYYMNNMDSAQYFADRLKEYLVLFKKNSADKNDKKYTHSHIPEKDITPVNDTSVTRKDTNPLSEKTGNKEYTHDDIPTKIVTRINNMLANHTGMDPLFGKAAGWVVVKQKATAELLQKKFRIGENRANRILLQLEDADIISALVGGHRIVQFRNRKELIRYLSGETKNYKKDFTREFYNLLKGFSPSLYSMMRKLSTDENLLKYVSAERLEDSSPPEFISHCVVYDLIQITCLLEKESLTAKSLEATGMVLLVSRLMSIADKDLLEDSFETIVKKYKAGNYKYMAKGLLEMKDWDNPMEFKIQKKEDEKIVSEKVINHKLALPPFLKISENPLFDEYATILYRYANIIVKADGMVNNKEESLLKKIYKITHHPLQNKENKALNISKADGNETLDSVLKELNELIGLNDVKEEINTLINFIKIQKARERSGLKVSPISYHIVFTGNPGTGKTTVARIIARIYKHLGILKEGQLVETDRAGLVAEYLGQTAAKVNKAVDSALDGILFIDEAYSLVGENKDDFGKEAVATLIKRMEDDRDKLVIILAGYTNEMKQFIDTNPGFKSRFNRYIQFPDYKSEELLDIFELKCRQLEYQLRPEAKDKLGKVFGEAYSHRTKSFGNGRFVRNIFEKTLERQANRIAGEKNLTKEVLTTIMEEDVAE